MSKTGELGLDVIRYTFQKLPVRDRLRVVEELERQTRRQRWDQLVTRVRQRVAKHPIAQEEIDRICDEVRQEAYERRTQGRR